MTGDSVFVVLSLFAPLLLAALLVVPATRPWIRPVVWTAAVPALVLAIAADIGVRVDLPWVLTGVSFGLDELARVFLLFSALLWMVSGLYARVYMKDDPRSVRFHVFFLLALAGNIGLILARDMPGFYLCFAVMSLSAWGLIIHDGTAAARRAGWVYIVLVVIGEALLVAGMLLAAAEAGTALDGLAARLAQSTHLHLLIGLFLVGFGIKAGVVPLHMWLPLAHPVAPTPASAVLSGAMIKAGLLGWLRFLPLGETAQVDWGGVCVFIGMFTAFYGVAVGVTQANAKTVLAYSSISQMGLMTVGIGIGLAAPALSPVVMAAIVIYALHHGMAKGALFLGAGIAARGPQRLAYRATVAMGLLLPALSIAGAPLSSGMPAKALLKEVIFHAQEPWAALLLALLPIAALGSMLLMVRFLTLAWPRNRGDVSVPLGLLLPWGLLLLGVASLAWIEFSTVALAEFTPTISVADVWTYTWPVVLGAVLAFMAGKYAWWRGYQVPAGDIIVLFEKAIAWCGQRPARSVSATPARVLPTAVGEMQHARFAAPILGWEGWLGRWSVAMGAFVVIVVLLVLMRFSV
ncbi:MAG: complex I subunit 5 family protein [Burkholderiales bacterium]|nr:complex I subunit 5 family protein [Burkholderiales bacterium]